MWHFIDGPTFEVAFYKWARFDSKRSTKVCAAEEVYNWAPVEVSKMELVQSSQNCQKERESNMQSQDKDQIHDFNQSHSQEIEVGLKHTYGMYKFRLKHTYPSLKEGPE